MFWKNYSFISFHFCYINWNGWTNPKTWENWEINMVVKYKEHVLKALKGIYFLLVLMDMMSFWRFFYTSKDSALFFVIVVCWRIQEEFGKERWVIQAFHWWKVILKFIVVVNKFWKIASTELGTTNFWRNKDEKYQIRNVIESSWTHVSWWAIFTICVYIPTKEAGVFIGSLW